MCVWGECLYHFGAIPVVMGFETGMRVLELPEKREIETLKI
jgi:hypothetical protein